MARIYRVVCLHGSIFCEFADATLRRAEEVARRYFEPLVRHYEEVRGVIGEPITVLVVFPGAPREAIERVVGREIASRILEAYESGFAGFTVGTLAVAIGDDELEVAETAAEEFLHALLSAAAVVTRGVACRLAMENTGMPCSDLDDWLAEELMVKWMLVEAGVLTRDDYMEDYERYADIYRTETGREPPFSPEDTKTILSEVSKAVRELMGGLGQV